MAHAETSPAISRKRKIPSKGNSSTVVASTTTRIRSDRDFAPPATQLPSYLLSRTIRAGVVRLSLTQLLRRKSYFRAATKPFTNYQMLELVLASILGPDDHHHSHTLFKHIVQTYQSQQTQQTQQTQQA